MPRELDTALIAGILLVCRPSNEADHRRTAPPGSAEASAEAERDLNGFVCSHCWKCAAAVARHRCRGNGARPDSDRSGPPAPGQAQAGLHAAHRHGRSRGHRQRRQGQADRPQGRTEVVPVSQRLRRRRCARSAPRTSAQKNPVRLVEEAVRGMLPKTKMGEAMWRKLKVYAGAEHPHAAQKPQAVKRQPSARSHKRGSRDSVLRHRSPQNIHRPRVSPARQPAA